MVQQILTCNFKFVSPLFIGGANKTDPDGIRGSSVRGQLRHWFRAIATPLLDFESEPLFIEEEKLFGSTEKMTFRMRIKLIDEDSWVATDTRVVPKRKFPLKAYPAGLNAKIEFQILDVPTREWLNAFIASIWMWGNFGSLGRRGRRGAGSIAITNLQTTEKQEFDDFPVCEENITRDQLLIQLKSSLLQSQRLISVFLGNKSHTAKPRASSIFHVASPKHVFVGRELNRPNISNSRGAIEVIMSKCSFLKNKNYDVFRNLLGDERKRLASPLAIRLTPVNNNMVVPVAIWSPPIVNKKLITSSPLDPLRLPLVGMLLKDLGFEPLSKEDLVWHDF